MPKSCEIPVSQSLLESGTTGTSLQSPPIEDVQLLISEWRGGTIFHSSMTTPSSSQLVFFQSVPRPPLCAGPSLSPILVRVCSIHSLANALKNSRSSVENHPSPPLFGSSNSMNSSIVNLSSSARVLLTHATALTFADSQSSSMMISNVAREYSNIFSNVIDPHCSSRLPPPPPICSIFIGSSMSSGF